MISFGRTIGITLLLLIIALAASIASFDTTTTADSSDIIKFRACFGVILAIFACAQLYVAIKLYQNRSNSLIELFQPVSLALFAIAGAIATLACFTFALPEYDVSCAIRQPVILVCISFMGKILLFCVVLCLFNVYQS